MTPPNPPTLDLELDELDDVLAKHARYGGRGSPCIGAGVLRKLIDAARDLERLKADITALRELVSEAAEAARVGDPAWMCDAIEALNEKLSS